MRPRGHRHLVNALLILAVTCGSLAGPSPATAGTTDPDGVTSVVAFDDAVLVRGRAPAGADVAVHALGTHQDAAAWREDRPVAGVTAGVDTRFAVRVPRTAAGPDPLYAKYLAVVDDEVLGTYRYVDDLRVTPLNTYPYPQSPTKKGLQVQMTADAEELGIGHAAVNVALDQLAQKRSEGPSESIGFASGGRTFFFDRRYVESLDRAIRPLSDNGQVVNLILILYRNAHPNSAFDVLVHPDWDAAGGPVFGFNTATAEGVAHYTAAIEFIADRWTREDQRYGRATGLIVGNEVDAQWTWQNMGEKPLGEFLRYYERALRITDLAARTRYRHARTYTSLTHSWTTPSGPAQPAGRYYPGRDVIDGLNALSKAHGDYPWHVAYHPYPEDLRDPAFWNDTTATGDVATTGRITFKNIELLPRYLTRPALTYRGQPRRVILSEQGCDTPGDTVEAERLQAACFALAYYKVDALGGIDSFILHRHVDHQREGGLRLGLWTWDEDRPEPSSPGDTKVIYDVFRDIDTERSLPTTDFALDVIGIDDWSELVDGWDPDDLARRAAPIRRGASTTARPLATTRLFDFEDGTQGWRPSDSARSVRVADGALRVTFRELAKLWRGADVVLDPPVNADTSPYLSLRVRADAPDAVGARYLKVRAYGADGTVGEGLARLGADDDWRRVVVGLDGWSGRDAVERLKVWVRGSSNADWNGSVLVDDVQLAERVAGSARATNVDLAAKAPDGVAAGAPLRVTVTNLDLASLAGELEVTTCDHVPASVMVTPTSLPVSGLPPGDSRTFEVTVTAAAPAAGPAPTLCFSLLGRRYAERIEVPPPTPRLLYGFDDGTVQGWQAGDGVRSVSAVTGFANGPGRPRDGSHALDGAAEPAPATAPKTVFVEPPQPLDLSDAAEVVAHVNSYGGVPGATGYEATFTLSSGANTVTLTRRYQPDTWNELVLDVRQWPGRTSVDRIEVSMRAVGTDFADWAPHVQVDSVVSYDRARH